MPSASIHMSVTKLISKKLNKESLEFSVGNIAPDCWRHSILHSDKLKSHFSKSARVEGLDMMLEDYNFFYEKYKNNLDNDFTLGYLTHLMTDYYWKNNVVPRYQIKLDSGVSIKLKNGQNYNGTKEEIKELLHINNQIATYNIAKHFDLKVLEESPKVICKVEEIDLSGLSKTIAHINKVNFTETTVDSSIYELDDLYKDIENCCEFIINELKNMEKSSYE